MENLIISGDKLPLHGLNALIGFSSKQKLSEAIERYGGTIVLDSNNLQMVTVSDLARTLIAGNRLSKADTTEIADNIRQILDLAGEVAPLEQPKPQPPKIDHNPKPDTNPPQPLPLPKPQPQPKPQAQPKLTVQPTAVKKLDAFDKSRLVFTMVLTIGVLAFSIYETSSILIHYGVNAFVAYGCSIGIELLLFALMLNKAADERTGELSLEEAKTLKVVFVIMIGWTGCSNLLFWMSNIRPSQYPTDTIEFYVGLAYVMILTIAITAAHYAFTVMSKSLVNLLK